MNREAEFNRSASDTFCAEYERETGIKLKFKRLGSPFPDAILETDEGKELGVEFASVVLSFIWQEESYFKKYRERFYEAIRPERPRYSGVAIRLQISSTLIEGHRPHRLPDVDGSEGSELVREFRTLLAKHFEILRAGQGTLLSHLPNDPKREFPTLSKYFDAILVWDINKEDERKPHIQDPVIELPIAMYSSDELREIVTRTLSTKSKKGVAYNTHFLVLHTLESFGKPFFPGSAMHAKELATLGRELLAGDQKELAERFIEIWLLNAFTTEGKKLYRLK